MTLGQVVPNFTGQVVSSKYCEFLVENYEQIYVVFHCQNDFNPLDPDGSYMIHGSYGRNIRPGAKGLTLIDQEWSINI